MKTEKFACNITIKIIVDQIQLQFTFKIYNVLNWTMI